MKRTIWAVFLLAFFALPSQAQFEASFNRLFDEGMEAMSGKDYSDAISHFLAASRADRVRSEEADSMVLVVMKLIEQQRITAEKATREALNAKRKSDQLASYFFADTSTAKAAWALGSNGKFTVINKEGEKLTDFIWTDPEPFIAGQSIAKRYGKYVFLNEKGIVISKSYNWLHLTTLGLYFAIRRTYHDEKFPLASNGNEWNSASSFTYWRIFPRNPEKRIANQWVPFKSKDNIGLFNLESKKILPLKYRLIRAFSEGKAGVWRNGNWGFIDSLGFETIPTSFEDLHDFKEGIARVLGNDKWGLIDSLGNEIIPYQFDYIGDFSNGIAMVIKGDKQGYINSHGQEITTIQYESVSWKFQEELAAVKKGNKSGYIDKFGKEVIPFIYEETRNFSFGRGGFKKNGKYGFINKKNQEIISPIYREVREFSSKGAWVKLGEKWGMIDSLGKELRPCTYDQISWEYSEGKISVQQGEKWGYVNSMGKEIISPTYEKVHDFFCGLAIVMKNGESFFIDSLGNKVMRNYDGVFPFEGNVAKVTKNEKWGLIDSFGKELLPPKFEKWMLPGNEIIWTKGGKIGLGFSPNKQITPIIFQKVGFYSEGLIKVKKENKWGYLDSLGNETISIEYDSATHFSEGLASVKKGNLWGYINKMGTEMIPFKYDETWAFSNDIAKVKIDGRFGFINKKGHEITDVKYNDVGSFSKNGNAWVKIAGKYGYINNVGSFIVEPKYEEAGNFYIDRAMVKRNNLYGYIDAHGKEIITPKYENAGDFLYGRAPVRKNGKYGYIDQFGNELTPFQFESGIYFQDGILKTHLKKKPVCINILGNTLIEPIYDSFNEIAFRVFLTKLGDKFGMIALSGYWNGKIENEEVVRKVRHLDPEYDEIGFPWIGLWTPVRQGDKWGLVHWEESKSGIEYGMLRIPCIYDQITPFKEINGELYARAYIDEYNLDFFINTKGEMLAEILVDEDEMRGDKEVNDK